MTGFIYAIESGGRIKLGYSKKPNVRLNKIASDTPFPCILLGYWPGTVADELDVHAKFHECRTRGEWFMVTEPLLAFIAANVIPVPASTKLSESSNIFKRWRAVSGFKQKAAAKACGVDRLTWWRWENDASKVAVELLSTVEAVTGIPRRVLRPDIFTPSSMQDQTP
ncbi:GIY-YIG nuclease family protein [Mesorhizobium sp. M0028]|uniref:GIY-YIG nuclease family protein n=1 Tax=Mesorhizobium sp. M0028 TaxID=2956849 RepID=UPI003334DED7